MISKFINFFEFLLFLLVFLFLFLLLFFLFLFLVFLFLLFHLFFLVLLSFLFCSIQVFQYYSFQLFYFSFYFHRKKNCLSVSISKFSSFSNSISSFSSFSNSISLPSSIFFISSFLSFILSTFSSFLLLFFLACYSISLSVSRFSISIPFVFWGSHFYMLKKKKFMMNYTSYDSRNCTSRVHLSLLTPLRNALQNVTKDFSLDFAIPFSV